MAYVVRYAFALNVTLLSSCFFSIPVLDVRADLLELGEHLREEGGLCVDPQHGRAQLVDEGDAAVPEAVLVRLNQEGLQGVADFVAHVAGRRRKIFFLKMNLCIKKEVDVE